MWYFRMFLFGVAFLYLAVDLFAIYIFQKTRTHPGSMSILWPGCTGMPWTLLYIILRQLANGGKPVTLTSQLELQLWLWIPSALNFSLLLLPPLLMWRHAWKKQLAGNDAKNKKED